jgi:hypothetical protein
MPATFGVAAVSIAGMARSYGQYSKTEKDFYVKGDRNC